MASGPPRLTLCSDPFRDLVQPQPPESAPGTWPESRLPTSHEHVWREYDCAYRPSYLVL